MNHRHEYLKYLLEKERWTNDEQEWMFSYLDKNELSELESIAADEFNMDVASFSNVRDMRLSHEILKSIHQQIDVPKPSLTQVIRLQWTKYAVAACVVLLLGIGFLLMGHLLNTPERMPAQQVSTAANERKTVELPDGSFVSLEPGSLLEYPEKFSGITRQVHLKGEAFFEIKKDAAHPFVVQSKYVKTTVLGTSFNVEAYESQVSKVVVITGKVKVEAGNKQQTSVLLPNESVIYNNATGELVQKEAISEAQFYQHRRIGKFNYRGVGLDKVIEDLQRYYNTTITIGANIKSCKFYGDLLAGDKLDKSLNLIAMSVNATVKKDPKSGYLIEGGSCR